MLFEPKPYQDRGRRKILEHPRYGLFMDMGLGKTATVLTAVHDLIFDCFEVERVLVVAPKNVALTVWPAEIEKWDQLQGLDYSVIYGDKMAALYKPAQIYITNYESLPWLARHWKLAPQFDMLVIDESTWVKNQSAKRFSYCLAISELVKRTVILTGKPVPNGLIDMWAQIYLLDRGARLCSSKTDYTKFYFIPNQNSHGFSPRKGAIKEITDRIGDITLTLRAQDYLDMPELIHNKIEFRLPEKLQEQYDDLESKFFLELQDQTITAFSAGALSMKLRQFVSGFVYDESTAAHAVHTARLEALKELIESLSGKNILLLVQFRAEIQMIRDFLGRDVPAIYSETSTPKDLKVLADWSARKLPLLMANPASIGYGLNMQDGGADLLWYSQTWNLDLYDQTIARLWRQGQTSAHVVNHILCMRGTIDMPIYWALQRKSKTQTELLELLKRWRTK